MIDTSDIDTFVNEVEKVFGKVYVEIFPRMSRGDMELIMIKKGNVLVPVSDDVAEELETISDGEVKVEITKPRNIGFHRKFFSLLRAAYKIWDQPITYYKGYRIETSFEEFRKNITILCGHFYMDVDIRGKMRARAKSISFAKMDEVEFEKLYSKAVDVIIERVLPTWTRHELDDFVRRYG